MQGYKQKVSLEAVNSWKLTPRQWEILGLIANGWSNRAIAKRLLLKVKSVENNTNNIYRQMDLHWQGEEHVRVRAVLLYQQAGGPPPLGQWVWVPASDSPKEEVSLYNDKEHQSSRNGR